MARKARLMYMLDMFNLWALARFDLDPGPKEGDAVFAHGGAQLVVDSVSLEFVRGAKVDYAAELIKSNFEVRL